VFKRKSAEVPQFGQEVEWKINIARTISIYKQGNLHRNTSVQVNCYTLSCIKPTGIINTNVDVHSLLIA